MALDHNCPLAASANDQDRCGRGSCVAGLNPIHRFRNCGSFFRRVVRLLAEPGEAQAAVWLTVPQVTVTTLPEQVITMVGEEGGAGGRLGIGLTVVPHRPSADPPCMKLVRT